MSTERDRRLDRAQEALAEKDEEARAKEQQVGGADDDREAHSKGSEDGEKSADEGNQ